MDCGPHPYLGPGRGDGKVVCDVCRVGRSVGDERLVTVLFSASRVSYNPPGTIEKQDKDRLGVDPLDFFAPTLPWPCGRNRHLGQSSTRPSDSTGVFDSSLAPHASLQGPSQSNMSDTHDCTAMTVSNQRVAPLNPALALW